MAWNTTVSTKENTLLKHGGGPVNNVYRYLKGINLGLISADFEPKVTTATRYYDGALRLRDMDDDADLIFDTSELDLDADVHQYVKFPMITNVELTKRTDRVVMNKTSATLEQKTIVLTDNHVKGTSAVAGDLVAFTDIGAGVIDLRRLPKGTAGQYPKMNPAADGFVWQTPGTDIASGTITDAMIASHTSTKITITAKGQLNSQIAYKDETGWLTDAMVASHTSTKITITNRGQLPSPLAYEDEANVFSTTQVIDYASSDPLYLRRNINTVGSDTRLAFQLKDSASNNTTYGSIDVRIGVNTDTTETGYMDINLLNAGSLQQLFVFDKNQFSIGVTGARAVLDSSLISGSSKTSQLPNVAGVLVNSGSTGVITDSMVASHTSTKITITSKSQLNSQIAYLDATAWLTDAMVASHTSTKISITAKAQLNSQIAYLDATAWLTDAMVASHTSTKISITNKAQLNSNILYKDVDNALGAHYVLMDKITTPATPAAGKIAIFADSGSGYLAMIDSAGVITDITAGTGGGGGGTGDVVGGSNLGAGVGVYKQENASHVLEFKSLNNGTVVTVAANGDGNTIDLGIAATSITNSMLAGSIAYSKLSLSGSVADADIASHTSTKITITAKGQLNSNIFYKDANNDIGAFYLDIGEIAAPSAPGASKNRIYWDSTTHRPTWKDSTNTTRSLVSAPTYIGTGLQVLRTNTGATATEWATLDNFKVANFSSTGNGSTTAFNINHGMGTTPTYVIAVCINQAIHMTYAVTSSQIQCTFASAPANTSAINIMWLAIL